MCTSKFSLSEVMNMLEDDQLQYSDDLFESNGEQSYDVNEIFDNVPNDLCDQQFSEQNETNLNTFDNVDDSISLAHNSEENLSTIPDTVTLNFYHTSRLPESEISDETCDSHFKDYQKSSSVINFKGVPYTKVKVLRYTKSQPLLVEFKLAFSEQQYQNYILVRRQTRTTEETLRELPSTQQLRKVPVIPLNKKSDLSSMLKYMPAMDQEFYRGCKL